MLVYLVRHGEAVSEIQHTSRPLSENGKAMIHQFAELLNLRFTIMPGRIYHSPKLRAEQTAAILSRSLPGNPALTVTDGLSPMDDPAIWAQRLVPMDLDTMLVGHLPHLSRLASHLLLSDSGRELLEFTPGALACLENSGGWKVKWMVSPDTLKNV